MLILLKYIKLRRAENTQHGKNIQKNFITLVKCLNPRSTNLVLFLACITVEEDIFSKVLLK